MRMIQVTDHKINKLSEMIEEMLTIGGKVMHCVSELEENSSYGERSRSRYRDEEMEYEPHYRMRNRNY